MELMDKTIWQLVRALPKRAVLMVSKFIGVKGAIFGVATFLLLRGNLETWAWVVISGIVIFGREFLKFMKDVR